MHALFHCGVSGGAMWMAAPLHFIFQCNIMQRVDQIRCRCAHVNFPLCFTVLPFLDFFSFLLSGLRDPVFAG